MQEHMALLNQTLSVWDIAFRWAGFDPDRLWWRIPLPVRDNFRVFVHEIWHSHLECENLSMRKRQPDDDLPPEFFIRAHLDTIEDCVYGKRYSRPFLRFAHIDRWAMHTWCERYKVLLPEFWFPPGWNLEYEWPDDDPDEEAPNPEETKEDQHLRLDKRHRTQMACQQIAVSIWAK